MGCERGRAQDGQGNEGQSFVSCSTRTAGEVNRHGVNVLMLDHSQVVQAAAR
jgi:hypothetical protein